MCLGPGTALRIGKILILDGLTLHPRQFYAIAQHFLDQAALGLNSRALLDDEHCHQPIRDNKQDRQQWQQAYFSRRDGSLRIYCHICEHGQSAPRFQPHFRGLPEKMQLGHQWTYKMEVVEITKVNGPQRTFTNTRKCNSMHIMVIGIGLQP